MCLLSHALKKMAYETHLHAILSILLENINPFSHFAYLDCTIIIVVLRRKARIIDREP